MPGIHEGKGGVYVAVRLKPGAKRDAALGWQDDTLRVEVKAPPVEGKANAALEAFLASLLGVPRSTVQVARGGKSRLKSVFVEGLDAATAAERLGT